MTRRLCSLLVLLGGVGCSRYLEQTHDVVMVGVAPGGCWLASVETRTFKGGQQRNPCPQPRPTGVRRFALARAL